MITVSATLDRWSAWAPGFETQAQWRDWSGDIHLIDDQGVPDMSFLPAMFRRRLSRLSKLALKSAFECRLSDAPVSTVFASRHGELSTSMKLLEDIAGNTPLSPTAFSTSVHNTASGMYSIAAKDKSPSTAIAAGINSLEAGFIEAASQLACNKHPQVLLILAEEPIHPYYSPYADMLEKPFSLAMLLSRNDSAQDDSDQQKSALYRPAEAKSGMKLSLSSKNLIESTGKDQQHGLLLIQLLTGKTDTLATSGELLSWNWGIDIA